MKKISSEVLKQLVFIVLIVAVTILIIWQLWYFIPGLLGAFTLYICLRGAFFKLTIIKKWKKWKAMCVLLGAALLSLALPVWGIIQLMVPKLNYALHHTNDIKDQLNQFKDLINTYIPEFSITEAQVQKLLQFSTTVMTSLLNGTAHVLVNILIAFFIVYFMLQDGRNMEKAVNKIMPLKDKSKDSIWLQTRNIVISNALGIPLLIACQCVVAILGYWIFGVEQYVFWGIITGVASIVPIVGCMVVYTPLCAIMIASGDVGMGIALFAYCAIVVSNVDNVLRFALMKKIGDVHPLITVFGVILGLQIFGMMGLIFGPLILAYFVLLLKLYKREFSDHKEKTTTATLE